MKTLQSSSHGRGRGRGRGRGSEDKRFASRFTDPRFQLSSRGQQRQRQRPSPREQMVTAARHDPRFARHLGKEQQYAREHDDEDTEEEEEDVEVDEMESDGEAPSQGSGSVEDVSSGDEDEPAAWSREEVEYIEPKRRIAIVNCDWDHIRAVDLYTILFNALPLGGQLLDVCQYMSDFGKRMIEHERMHGPDLWVKPTDADAEPGDVEAVNEDDEDDGDDGDRSEGSEPSADDGWQDDNPDMKHERGEDGEYFSSGKYRQYELNRMKYYYAVATFDSADTAAAVYNELDGMDIEASGVTLDLRYVDDEEVFENPVSRADCVPSRFKPLGAFKSAALSNTRFRISWDQDDVFRHQSVQDAFTGTTEEDDLAAYLAPPDSDDDEVRDARTGRTRAEEKARIRRKYAALLEEIGGLPEEAGDSPDRNGGARDSDSGSGSDDDLNRFSDVELASDSSDGESGSEAGSNDYGADGDEVMGEVEGTLDLDAGMKAAHLQRDARLKQKIKDGDLAARAELRYKQRRKEMKKAKKEMAMQEREAEREALAATKEERKRTLKTLLGTDDDGAVHRSGKERRKEHARQVKQRLAQERADRKQMRAASRLGVTRAAKASLEAKEADAALNAIDSRFQAKLLGDSRFHLEVSTKDKRIAEDVQALAATVAKARRGKRARGEEPADAPGKAMTNVADAAVDSTVDYFLSRPDGKTRRRNK